MKVTNVSNHDIFGIPLADCIPYIIKIGAIAGLIAGLAVTKSFIK